VGGAVQARGETKEEPLSDEIMLFLTGCKINIPNELLHAFHNLGFECLDDFDDLDQEMMSSLEIVMKPLEVVRLHKGLKKRKEGAVETMAAVAGREKVAGEKVAREKVARERPAFSVGESVTWIKSDSDVPKGTVGKIIALCDDGVKASVTFYSGSWKFPFTQLRASSKQPTKKPSNVS